MDKNRQTTSQPPQVDANRRRLTKAGLAAPAILGTLASRRVLGADYYCTTSGQTSGNTSTHGPDDGCTIAGALTPSAWATTDTWTGINKNADFNGFTLNGASLPSNVFFKKNYGGQNCSGVKLVMSTVNGRQPASLLEVLTLSNMPCDGDLGPSQELVDLARATIATIANASKVGNDFPIRPQEAIAMFSAVYGTGSLGGSYVDSYWLNKNARWNATDVLCYFKLLYGEVLGCSGLTT